MPLRLCVCFRNFKCTRGHSDPFKNCCSWLLALNCESIRLRFKVSIWLLPVREITVAQQSVIYTRFLFKNILMTINAHLETISKVKNEVLRYIIILNSKWGSYASDVFFVAEWVFPQRHKGRKVFILNHILLWLLCLCVSLFKVGRYRLSSVRLKQKYLLLSMYKSTTFAAVIGSWQPAGCLD